MKTLMILNDPPYGTERCYNALPLANSIATRDGEHTRRADGLDFVGRQGPCLPTERS